MVNPAQWLDPDWKLERNDKKGFHVTGTLGELWFQTEDVLEVGERGCMGKWVSK